MIGLSGDKSVDEPLPNNPFIVFSVHNFGG